MATSAATRADGLTTEQLACLAGGPRRVVEVAVLALVRAGAVRVGRNGVVSAVSGASPRTGAQAAVLAHLGQHLGNVVEKASDSTGARAVRDELLALGLLRSPAFQERVRAARAVLVILACLLAAALVVLPEHLVATLALLVALLLVRHGLGFWTGMVNGRGRAVLRDAPSAIAGRVDWSERVIALVGLQGGFQGRPAHEFTVVPESAVRTMRPPR
ncbi:TIGR04222 domain-containing membrane protein, partial [Actinosynnema sp.]|uniref:TIGR04222 domain-containing membrane protein n=1 Tax=Actinosynnema sp. TaxID=1872144 RepID=UPI003F876725